jgi:hypothetical protein
MIEAELIRRLRQAQHLTQAELAKRARTSQAMIARYEAGSANPTIRTLERIIGALGHDLTMDARPRPSAALAGPMGRRVHRHRQRILDLAHAKGASNVRVFGSVARGQDSTQSDIDVLVDFPVYQAGLFPLIVLETELEDLLTASVDVAAEVILKDGVRQRALAEAVPL